MNSAVVFAYHDVGVRCLSVLLAHGVDIKLVITHADNPSETIWFDSVAQRAAEYDLPCLIDPAPNQLLPAVRKLAPDFIFSFYYRQMLPLDVLNIARRGALNMHGSLLPKYRGRVPVNWAVLHGEAETGASLHYMAEKPDAGDLVDQQAVPILPDDTAGEVFHKVACAAEIVLHRSLPGLLAGTAPRRPLDLSAGSYFGGRKPADGEIDWLQPARAIHNLVRAVAPPYPGATSTLQGQAWRILKTRLASERAPRQAGPRLYVDGGRAYVDCVDGQVLAILDSELNGEPLSPQAFTGAPILLGKA